jgi:hypothetical protein
MVTICDEPCTNWCWTRHPGYLYACKVIDKRLAKLRNAAHLVANEQRALANCESPFVSNLRYAFSTTEVRVASFPSILTARSMH